MPLTPDFDPGAVRDHLDALAPEAGPLLLGYSGGGDSHALLLIASQWARERGRSLEAVVVDHGLRAGSADEARRAEAAARAAGCAARIFTCPPYRGRGGLQAWARQHRYLIFAEAARDTGAPALLLAHTADDQAETVWMRLIAGAGYRGLAAMSLDDPFPVATDRGLRILRPLLESRRENLRNWLRAQGADWIEDPSNTDRRYTRVRTRQTLARLEAAGLSTSGLTRLSRSCADLNTTVVAAAAHLFARAAPFQHWGGARLDRAGFAAAPEDVGKRALEAACRAVSGAPVAARGLDALWRGLRTERPASGTGTLLIDWKGAAWLVRDPGSVLGRHGEEPLESIRIAGARTALWDGRFRIAAPADRDVQVAAWDQLPDTVDRTGIDLAAIPPLARATLPVVHAGGTVLAIPGVTGSPGVTVTHEAPALARRSLFAGRAPAWFYGGMQRRGGTGSQMPGNVPI